MKPNDLNGCPLVSIIVITYNSSNFVFETLESIKAQTYPNIELVISDDCSTDSTIDICREWINNNKTRFIRTELITVAANTGIPANCNRGIKSSYGEWVKLIAGDDVLINNCIADAMNFAKNETDCKIFASNVRFFTDNISAGNNITTQSEDLDFFHRSTTAKGQFETLAYNNVILAPSVFIAKNLILEQNGFDESINKMEDYPFWLKSTHSGYRIGFMKQVTVGYRLSKGSASGYHSDALFNAFYKDSYNFKKRNTFKYLSRTKRISLTYTYIIQTVFDSLKINNIKFKSIYYLFMRMNFLRKENI